LDNKIIDEIRNRLVDLFKPTAIFIFGSYAWGTPGKDSDLDIAVIVGESDEKPYKSIQKGTLALWDIKIPIDLLVFTSKDFGEKSKFRSTLQYQINLKGIKIYENPTF
jgi:uncharacterized protein